MTTIEVPFTMAAQVGDSTIEDAVSGAISVNLYDDPEQDEINAWRFADKQLPLAYKLASQMERLAIEEARQMHLADLAEGNIAAE